MPHSDTVLLPSNVRPISYDLTLEPDLDAFTFCGEETVRIEIVEATATITIHSIEIAIQACSVTLPDGLVLTSGPAVFDADRETVTFELETPLPVGPATVEIEFTGVINDKLRGFYRSLYADQSGVQQTLVSTQFEPTDARRAFPCWDEPTSKASFRVALRVPSELAAISNMQIVEEVEHRPGVKEVRFAETPIMSTYLVAFAVGNLRSVEQTTPDGTLIRVWANAGKEEHGRVALETSVRLLEYLNDYFGIPYPLDKLDHIAIPDFAAGAMENWGAITYRENALLVDPQNSSAGTRQTVAAIIAHEMAHMWFGDLVTMEWWNDLWLNESFASWMGDKAVDHLFPEWEMWTQFVSSDTNRALSLDGLKSSHPIDQEVRNPAQIGELFDAISYSKGASILRMLEDHLGEEPFRLGLRRYLLDHQHGNATTRDLWDALAAESGQPVAAMMDSWTKQMGYPVLDVEVRRRPGEVEVSATQTRFTYERLLRPDDIEDATWQVPFSALAAGQSTPVSTLSAEVEMSVAVPAPATGTWVKVNPGQTGFYRVSYPLEEWARLREPIRALTLPAVDRLGLQNDAYALSRAGLLSVDEFLSLAEAYAGETDATVWQDLYVNLRGLDSLLGDQKAHPGFQEFARRLFQPVGQKVGWDAKPGEGHLDALLRSTVLGALGAFEDDGALAEAKSRFWRYAEDPESVRPDIRAVVGALAAKGGDRSTYDAMWDLRERATLQEEQVRLLQGLTQFGQPELVAETLERSLSERVRYHETIGVVHGTASNRSGRDFAWEFMKDNWAELDRRYGEGGFGLMALVGTTSGFTTEERLEDVRSFFEAHPTPSAQRTIQQSLERIRLNIVWLDLNREALAKRFGG